MLRENLKKMQRRRRKQKKKRIKINDQRSVRASVEIHKAQKIHYIYAT
jgi:hypothetical protein